MAVGDERQCFNHLVALTRWYGGHHMGPSRFEHIKKATHNAISLANGNKNGNETVNDMDTRQTVIKGLLHGCEWRLRFGALELRFG